MDFLNTFEKRERRIVHVPLGRFGEAVEVAKVALFRMSDFVCAIRLHSPNTPQWRLMTAVT